MRRECIHVCTLIQLRLFSVRCNVWVSGKTWAWQWCGIYLKLTWCNEYYNFKVRWCRRERKVCVCVCVCVGGGGGGGTWAFESFRGISSPDSSYEVQWLWPIFNIIGDETEDMIFFCFFAESTEHFLFLSLCVLQLRCLATQKDIKEEDPNNKAHHGVPDPGHLEHFKSVKIYMFTLLRPEKLTILNEDITSMFMLMSTCTAQFNSM